MHALRDAGGFDVLHVHAPFAAFAGAVASGVPTVHTVHGAFTERMRALYREAADRAWFVAISEAQRRSNDDLRYAGVVHNGVDLDAYPLRTDKDDYVLFLGRAAPEKGWLRAVEACRRSGDRLVSAVKVATAEEKEEWEESGVEWSGRSRHRREKEREERKKERTRACKNKLSQPTINKT
mgnify:CR=1 FL=1